MECTRTSPRTWFLAFACALLSACSRSSPPPSPLQTRAQNLVAIPGAQGSSHPQLQLELKQLAELKQLPEQIDAAMPASDRDRSEGAYASFVRAYPALTRPAIGREVNEIWPTLGTWFEPGAVQKAREIVSLQAAARQRFGAALDEHGGRPQGRIADALLADDEWLDAAVVGCRIEGLAVAEALAEQQPAAAVPLCERMLQVSRQLAAEPNLNARLVAVALRTDALQVLNAIANHPLATPEVLQLLQQRLIAHTADWPSDERVLQAERAQGLLIFELVRSGHYTSLLTKLHRSQLDSKGLIRSTEIAAKRDIDTDQLFYLRAMQQQVAAARLPFLQRTSSTEALQTELATREATGEYPLVAGTLLLPRIADVHLQLAQDRARCEAWLLVLTAVTEQPLGPMPVCPLTGTAYELQQDREGVKVVKLALKPGEAIQIRRPGLIQARRRAAGFDFTPASIR
ncbi:hypothetical protein ETAA8_52100 [Anatilimnocola aggregata]|uniref:Uncharacterized protein n=1 Tax=Anatilimnocola aggregata TaxID=2528021 RepID=A0A517YIQ7_9BACT|nr:hypothetical protein [Anatilimnocola aggregata]QDU30091.1 hypothetical protein ETAA8_52100 [Anatilimnocola aggregata]